MQVSDVIDMKEDVLNPSVLTVVLSEERGHVYQFQTGHDLAVFRSESCMTAYFEPACILEMQYAMFVTGLLSQSGSVASCLLNAAMQKEKVM